MLNHYSWDQNCWIYMSVLNRTETSYGDDDCDDDDINNWKFIYKICVRMQGKIIN